MTSNPTLKRSRLRRTGLLASTGLRMGIDTFRRGGSDAAARQAARVLGSLRGVAAKTGQLAGYVDGLLPDDQTAYQTWMQTLFASTEPSPWPVVVAQIEAELGRPMNELYRSWQSEPLACASIGQVHRAELHDGSKVVIKVQHPGIAEALESDLKNVTLLERAAGLFGASKLDSRRLLAEFCDKMREELDYEQERHNQDFFARFFAHDRDIVIPKSVATHSTRHVLTSEYIDGRSFAEACSAPEELRAAWCRTMWRFVFGGYLLGERFNADPHPGNYVFLPQGRVAFLDFGCVQKREHGLAGQLLSVHRAALTRDETAFFAGVKELLGTRGGDYERWSLAYVRHAFEPLFASPFRITRPYAASMVKRLKGLAPQLKRMDEREIVPLPPGMLFMNRLQCGFYSVLARLDVEVDYAEVEAQMLDGAHEYGGLP